MTVHLINIDYTFAKNGCVNDEYNNYVTCLCKHFFQRTLLSIDAIVSNDDAHTAIKQVVVRQRSAFFKNGDVLGNEKGILLQDDDIPHEDIDMYISIRSSTE